jgi:deoxyadenosine/deoxycytidine kinase
MKVTHVAVEGPIGVGKTTLARRLARHLDARLVLEGIENPFLDDFYAGKSGAAFQCQVYFLLTRYRQMRELAQEQMFERGTVADYIFPRDRIFAYLNLQQDDLTVYERLFTSLADQVPKPDLVIYLQASDEVLLSRIKKRGRKAEHRINPEYVSEVAKAFNYFFFHYTDTPLLVVNASRVDLASSEADFTELLRQVDQMEGGTRYFVPPGTTG